MAQAAPQRVFVSYSRSDSNFVDRLEADLRARDFDPWVDRQRLQVGQDWMDMIQNAIDGCEVLVVVLSPDAVQSQPVKTEYRYAIQTGKRVLPLQIRVCERVPIDLRGIQWVDFEQDYEMGLKGLLIGLASTDLPERSAAAVVTAQSPIQAAPEHETLVAAEPVEASPQVEINLRQLYASGAAARSRGDLERAAIFWQQILDNDPTYLNGLVASEMKTIGPQLNQIRIPRLREQANAAHDTGNWGQEVGAWQALLALEPNDAQAKARLQIAEQNRGHAKLYAELYEIIQNLYANNDIEAVKRQFTLLWSQAPYFGDPDGIAAKIGMTLPPTYEQVQAAEEARRQQAQAAEAARRQEAEAQRQQQALALKRQEEAQRAEAARKFAAEIERTRRPKFIKEELNTTAFGVWMCLVCFLACGGTVVALLVASQASVFPKLPVPVYIPAAVVAVVVLAVLAYALGYRQAVKPHVPFWLALASGALACVLAWIIPSMPNPMVRYYSFPGKYLVHLTPGLSWGFGVAMMLLFLIPGLLIFGGFIIGEVNDGYADGALVAVGAGCAGLLSLVGFILGVTVSGWGWFVAGLALGLLAGAILGVSGIFTDTVESWIGGSLLGPPVIGILGWILCGLFLKIPVEGIWIASLAMEIGLLGGAGIGASIGVFVKAWTYKPAVA